MRSVVFRYESVADLSAALAEARPVPRAPITARSRRGSDLPPPSSMRGGENAIPLPPGESVADGEWVLATFEIGSRRRATASAARGVKVGDAIWLEIERRDWERLQGFIQARSEHMRVSKPAPSTAAIPVAMPIIPPQEAPEFIEAPPRSRRFEDLPPSSVLESTRVPFGAKVLVVDADQESAENVRVMLTEAGLIVELVATGIGAEERMRVQSFDALVLDLHVPGLDARELVVKLRADPRSNSADIPVLFLSSRPTSRDAVDAFASGGDDFLPKPFRPTELAARIFGLLRRARLVRAANR